MVSSLVIAVASGVMEIANPLLVIVRLSRPGPISWMPFVSDKVLDLCCGTGGH